MGRYVDDFQLSSRVIVQQHQEPDESLQRTYTLDGTLLDLGDPITEVPLSMLVINYYCKPVTTILPPYFVACVRLFFSSL